MLLTLWRTRWIPGMAPVIVGVALSFWAWPALSAEPRLGFVDAVIQLPTRTPSGARQMLVKAENLPTNFSKTSEDLKVKDLGSTSSSTTSVEFLDSVVVDRGSGTRAWLITADVKNLPANTAQKRFARLTVSELEQLVEYTVTNLPPAGFTWSITAPTGPWLVWHDWPGSSNTAPIVVIAGDSSATNLHIAQASLRDTLFTSHVDRGNLELCEDAGGRCGTFAIDARVLKTFVLRLKRQGMWPWALTHGKLTGTVSFAVNERPELQAATITLYATSLTARGVGVLLIVLGTWLAWWMTVRGRSRVLRLEALKPVAALGESLRPLVQQLQNAPQMASVKPERAQQHLVDLADRLTTTALDARSLLPPDDPPAFGSVRDRSADLAKYLDAVAAEIGGVAIVISGGMRVVWKDCAPTLSGGQQTAISKALQALDELGGRVTERAGAEADVGQILRQYAADMTAAGAVSDASVLRPSAVSLQYINWEIARVQRWGWLLWGGLTCLTGTVTLILTNPGFGTPLDLVFCILWGFGLPVTVDKLQSLAPGSVASSIGISVAKP